MKSYPYGSDKPKTRTDPDVATLREQVSAIVEAHTRNEQKVAFARELLDLLDHSEVKRALALISELQP